MNKASMEAAANWFAGKAATYDPRQVDVPEEEFVKRIANCTGCEWRGFDTCRATPTRTICSVAARLPTGFCPMGYWGTPPAEAELVLPSSQVLPPPAEPSTIGPIIATTEQHYPRRHKRHLICHIYPRTAGQRWRATVAEIAARRRLFDTHTIIVATDETTDTAWDVEYALRNADLRNLHVIERANHRALGEVPAFRELLLRTAEIAGPADHVFYCHAKGSTWAESAAPSHEWRAAMFAACLDYPALVESLMERAAIVGPFRRYLRLANTIAPWHFSGTFFWFHAMSLRPELLEVPQTWSGVEAWPGTHFRKEESACLFLEDCADLYSSQYWDETVRPALRVWKERAKSATGRESWVEGTFPGK